MLKDFSELKQLERAGYSLREQWDAISHSPQILKKLGGDPRNITQIDSAWKKKLQHLFSSNEVEILEYLQKITAWVSPTQIGREVGGLSRAGKPRDSAWASPICKKLVEMGLAERNGCGHYRVKANIGQLPVQERRGFELKEVTGPLEITLIKANVYPVSLVLSRLLGQKGIWTTVTKLKSQQITDKLCGYLLHQYLEHHWTLFLTARKSGEQAQKLSQELKTTGVYWYFDWDTGWLGYELYEQGTLIETYDFGPEFQEEVSPKIPESREKKARIAVSDGYYSYHFSSTIRVVTEYEVLKGNRFLNNTFRSYDIYVPDLEGFMYYCLPNGYVPRTDQFASSKTFPEQTTYLIRQEQ